MAQYDGIISALKENGMAEVLIRPGSPGIPGASDDVNRRVCHCATDGSSITIEALNLAPAEVGDWVSVTRSSRALMKNATVLLGIPLMGAILGLVFSGLFTHWFTVHPETAYAGTGTGLMLGVLIGIWAFRGISKENPPIVDRVIKSRLEMARLQDDIVSGGKEKGGCEGCERVC